MLKCISIFLACCLIIYNILYLCNNVFRNKKYAQIFNIYISTEKEDSMSPEIKKNSLLIGCKVKNVNEGEIIGYDIDNSIRYHRLFKIKNNDGKTIIDKLINLPEVRFVAFIFRQIVKAIQNLDKKFLDFLSDS